MSSCSPFVRDSPGLAINCVCGRARRRSVTVSQANLYGLQRCSRQILENMHSWVSHAATQSGSCAPGSLWVLLTLPRRRQGCAVEHYVDNAHGLKHILHPLSSGQVHLYRELPYIVILAVSAFQSESISNGQAPAIEQAGSKAHTEPQLHSAPRRPSHPCQTQGLRCCGV